MNKYVIIALLCFLSIKISAQAINTDTIISLNSTTSPETPDIPISGIKIATALPDTTAIGYAGEITNNATFRLIPETAFTNWVQTFVNSKYTNIFDDTARQLVWVIKNLSVSKDSTGNTIYIGLKADVASSVSNKKFMLTSTVDTVIMSTGTNTNYSLGIEEAIQALFTVSANDNTPVSSTRYTFNELLTQAQQVYDIPVLRDSIYIRGVYRTFNEFKNNNPSISNANIRVDNKGNATLYQQLADSTSKEITSAWGICMAGEQYAYADGKLIPIEKSGKGIIVSRFQKPEVRQNQAIYWRNLMSNNKDTNPFDRKQNKKAKHKALSGKKNQPVATRIDIETGEVTF